MANSVGTVRQFAYAILSETSVYEILGHLPFFISVPVIKHSFNQSEIAQIYCQLSCALHVFTWNIWTDMSEPTVLTQIKQLLN